MAFDSNLAKACTRPSSLRFSEPILVDFTTIKLFLTCCFIFFNFADLRALNFSELSFFDRGFSFVDDPLFSLTAPTSRVVASSAKELRGGKLLNFPETTQERIHNRNKYNAPVQELSKIPRGLCGEAIARGGPLISPGFSRIGLDTGASSMSGVDGGGSDLRFSDPLSQFSAFKFSGGGSDFLFNAFNNYSNTQ